MSTHISVHELQGTRTTRIPSSKTRECQAVWCMCAMWCVLLSADPYCPHLGYRHVPLLRGGLLAHVAVSAIQASATGPAHPCDTAHDDCGVFFDFQTSSFLEGEHFIHETCRLPSHVCENVEQCIAGLLTCLLAIWYQCSVWGENIMSACMRTTAAGLDVLDTNLSYLRLPAREPAPAITRTDITRRGEPEPTCTRGVTR